MTKTKTLLACLLLAGSLAALPGASAQAMRVTIAGVSGTPVDANCSPDAETMGNVGGTMFFPHSGCAATYDPEAYGIPDGVPLEAVHVRYFVTGHVGTICGYFTFGGRITGTSGEVCTPHDTLVDVEFTGTSASSGSDLITLTWQATAAGFDNAYLHSFDVQTGNAPPPPPPPVGPCTPVSVVGIALSVVESVVRQLTRRPIGIEVYCHVGFLDDGLRVQ
jgi:hypothetical protein